VTFGGGRVSFKEIRESMKELRIDPGFAYGRRVVWVRDRPPSRKRNHQNRRFLQSGGGKKKTGFSNSIVPPPFPHRRLGGAGGEVMSHGETSGGGRLGARGRSKSAGGPGKPTKFRAASGSRSITCHGARRHGRGGLSPPNRKAGFRRFGAVEGFGLAPFFQ